MRMVLGLSIRIMVSMQPSVGPDASRRAEGEDEGGSGGG